jgi:probable DNA metabolism protein
MNYLYDGSFEGLMTVIYEVMKNKHNPNGIYPVYNYQESMLSSSVFLPSDTSKCDTLCRIVTDRISTEALNNIMYVFLSELENIGLWIYGYINLGLKVGRKVDLYLSDSNVLNIIDTRDKVLGERHRMLGLVRFKLLKGDVYYSSIESVYNIVGLTAPHFAERLGSQNFIIHDIKRNLAVLYNKRNWIITHFEMDTRPILSEEETQYQKLWNQFFKSISIPEKLNPRLQKRNMPQRYWKHLIEKQGQV